jgi:antitoxin component of MazEF toxin-antitoxin module
MKKLKVTNTGKRMRDRLGLRFLPNQEQEVEVNNRQYLTLKAVKDFEVEILDDTNNNTDDNSGNDTDINNENDINDNDSNDETNNDDDLNDTESDSDEELDYYDLNIDEVLKAVREGKIDVDEAIAREVAGKNRVTLLDQLEDMKQGE